MDNSDIATQWSTPAPAVAAMFAGGIALGVAAVVIGSDPAGTLLVALAALGLLVAGSLGALQRPKLAVVDVGTPQTHLAIRRLSGSQTYSRDEIVRARIVRYPRLGRRTPMLELDIQRENDVEDRLVIFGRWDLGVDPTTVLEALDIYGFVPPDPTPLTP